MNTPRIGFRRGRLRPVLVLALAAVSLSAARPARAVFEDIEVSPRSRALGQAFVALGDDDFAPFHNPASLAWADRLRVGASYLRPFGYDFSSQSVAAAQMAIKPIGGIALGFRHFGVEYKEKDLTSETTIALSQGFKLLEDLESTVAIGYTINLYSLDFGASVSGYDPGSATALGFDIAVQATVQERTRVGFYAINVNNPSIGDVVDEQLLRRVGAGLSYKPYPGVETVLDISNELGEEVQFRGGCEFQVVTPLWLRAGLRTQPNIFTAGAGFRHAGFRLDYALSTGGGTLDTTHHFGIGYELPLRTK
jgi:hypothetical protein